MKQKLRLGDYYALTKYKLKPYTIRYFSLLAVATIMCLYAVKQVSAQVAEPAATAVAGVKPLQIGDTIPEWLWHLPLQVVNRPPAGGRGTIALDDYRGKLIILDFWGTFCSACIAAMPKIHDLQRQFSNNMAVIPVSWSKPEATIRSIHSNEILKPLGLMSVVEAKALIRLFPHQVVPHYVWIDPVGKIIATTAAGDITAQNVERVWQGEAPIFAIKGNIEPDKPLLLEFDRIPQNVETQSYAIFLKGTIPGLGGGARIRTVDGIPVGIAVFNTSIIGLYTTIAWQKWKENPESRIIIKCADITDDEDYTLDFIVPVYRASYLYADVLDFVSRNTGYTARWVVGDVETLEINTCVQPSNQTIER